MSGDEGYGADGGFGWSGSETSRERAEDTGKMQRRLRQVLDLLQREGADGFTSGELEKVMFEGHGPVSAALSHLHKAGKITRLTERRGGRAQVYVHPDYVNGREEASFRPNRANRDDYRPTPLAHAVTGQDVQRALVETNVALAPSAAIRFLRALGIEVA